MSLQPLTGVGAAGALAGWIAPGGSAPPVLFIHPINMQGQIWDWVVDHLDGSRRCILPDLRAHGLSDPSGPFGLDEWLDDCVTMLDAAGVDQPVHVVGGSLGGSLACCFAARYPDRTLSIAGVGSSLNFVGVDVEPVLDMFAELGVAGTFRAVFPTLTFGPAASDQIIERGIALANPNDVEVVQQVWSATITSDSTELARTVDCPALVITGEHDATCTPALGLEMARELRTEQVLMPGIGHLPMLECPERLAGLLQTHFELAEARR